eukprot:12365364-Heterocapsa_arctica.AAC.2
MPRGEQVDHEAPSGCCAGGLAHEDGVVELPSLRAGLPVQSSGSALKIRSRAFRMRRRGADDDGPELGFASG